MRTLYSANEPQIRSLPYAEHFRDRANLAMLLGPPYHFFLAGATSMSTSSAAKAAVFVVCLLLANQIHKPSFTEASVNCMSNAANY
jgi:hypothetical protein